MGAGTKSIASCFRQYCLRIALLIFSDPWERWLHLQEEALPWAMADVLQVWDVRLTDETLDLICTSRSGLKYMVF